MIRIALVSVAVLIAIGTVVVVIGLMLPVRHVASVQRTMSASPGQLFAALTDVERFPAWRSDVTSVTVLSRAPLRWIEAGRNGRITFEQVEAVAPRRLVTKIADDALQFGGTWTYDLEPSGGGTVLTITERGEVYNPLFRVMSRFVFGYTASMESLAESLRVRAPR